MKDCQLVDWDCVFLFACCRVYIPSVVLGMPNLATVLPSMFTPATAPWLTGEYVSVCKCFPSCTRYIFTYQRAKKKKKQSVVTLIIIGAHPFFLFQLLQQLRWRLSDWWGKKMLMFCVLMLSSITQTMTAPSSVIFLISVVLFVCASLQSPSRVRSWSPQSLGRWGSSQMRSVSSRWALCFHLTSFDRNLPLHLLTEPILPYLIRHSLGLFQSDFKNKEQLKEVWATKRITSQDLRFGHACFS